MAISLTRLSGGTSPADGSDPRTFPAIWNSSATSLENVATDLDTLESTVSNFGVADLADANIGTEANGESLVYNGTDWVNGIPPVLETEEQTASYILDTADAGYIVNMNVSGASTVTVPPNSDAAFPIGTVIGIYNQSADDVTVTPGSGVTVRNADVVGQYGEASVRKRGTDEWVMVGG